MTAMPITVKVGDWYAIYRGGAYIDIHHGSTAPGRCVTCINVYDYEKGAPTIPPTRDAVRKALRVWLAYDENGWREADDIFKHVLPYL